MKKQVLFFLLFLVCGVSFHSSFSQTTNFPTIAVLDFENNSLFSRDDYESLSQGLAEMMITGLNQSGGVRVVERQKLRSILDEIKLSQTGAISDESTLRAGRLLGARYLVFGGFLVAMDNKIRIDVRIVEVETGLTLKANEVTGKTKDILNLIAKLNEKIIKDLNIRLAGNQKSSQGPSQVDIKAMMLYSEGVGHEDAGDTEKAADCYKKALDIEPDFKQAKTRLLRLNGK